MALALGSSVAWGTSDFLAGLQSRRISAIAVMLVSQPVGLVLALAFAIAIGGDSLGTKEALLGAGAGAVVVLALGAFYRAMALGAISVVAMIGALGVLVPVIAGLVRGERPEPIQVVGAAAAICGVVLVAREPDPEWRAAGRTALGLAALAALGFGVFFVGIDASAGERPAWTIVAARVGGVSALVVIAALVRPSMRIPGTIVPILFVIGFCDLLANALFAFATTRGLLSLVAVAGSLYSGVTVLLARVFLAERLRGVQRAGLGLAIAGVAMIAAGTG
ncbi:MAG TPA: DMT family transporter [Solirubrobacterales bacterium]|nr:DMT family transporter [Solirubrobacterales bacterium]